ncbi:MAG: hypothetical protein AABZ60_24305, partial [Planctomycetota bacterium]
LQTLPPQEKELQDQLLTVLLQALQSPFAPVRAKAVTVLSQQKSEVSERLSIPLLIKLLSEENILVKQWARHCFSRLSPKAFEEVLQEMPKHSEKIRLEILEALRYREISLSTESTLFLLSLAKQNKNRKESQLALEILGKTGGNLPEVLSLFIQIASDIEYPKEIRKQAIYSLGQTKKSSLATAKFLTSLLQDTDFDYVSAIAMAQIGERTPEVISVLIRYLQEMSEEDQQKEIHHLFISFGVDSILELLKYGKKEWFRPHLEKIILRILNALIEKLAKRQGDQELEAQIEKTIQSLLQEANRYKELSDSVRFILKELISQLLQSLKSAKSEEKMVELLANQILHQLAEAEKVAQEKGQKVNILRKFELNEHITLLREALNKSKAQ